MPFPGARGSPTLSWCRGDSIVCGRVEGTRGWTSGPAHTHERAAAGDGAALVLRGPPGVGKSALLDDVVAATLGDGEAPGMTVLRTRGVESEAPLPFAALHRLLRPVLDRLHDIPAPQSRALHPRSARRPGPPATGTWSTSPP